MGTFSYFLGECGENPCNSLPCQHGATCIKVDNDSYECLCPTGWVGKYDVHKPMMMMKMVPYNKYDCLNSRNQL